MISVGEIVALDSQELRIELWPNTSATFNIIRTNKATLMIVYRGKFNYIRLCLRRLKETPNAVIKKKDSLPRLF